MSHPDVFALVPLLPLRDQAVVIDRLRSDDQEVFIANPRSETDAYWPVEGSAEEVRRWVAGETGARNPALLLAIRAAGSLVGGVEARVLTPEIGTLDYWIFPRHRGCGYAKSAVGLVSEALRSACGLKEIQLRIRDANEPSLAIARSLGFREIARHGDEGVFVA